jgi:phosphatidate cytidylyltransferase
MGMYHRSYFVVICYAGIFGLAYSIFSQNERLYNLMPMLVLGVSCLVPLMRNNYQQMIQYISLTNLSFVFLGWCFMHMALLMTLPNGMYQLMYVTILTEVCDNTNLAISGSIGGTKIFDRIDKRRTWGGFFVSIGITILLAFAMRNMLPDRSDYYWLVSGVVASIGGLFGDMLMTVIRRDAGIKVVGAFVLGRGDFLHRMDRLIFVAPIYYYFMLALPKFLP